LKCSTFSSSSISTIVFSMNSIGTPCTIDFITSVLD
jgi:hypothetical protein